MNTKKISEYFLYFMMYAIIGRIYEVFLEIVMYCRIFSNRGTLFGPRCVIYGFGSLIFLFTVYPLIKNKKFKEKLLFIPVVFLLCMAIATGVELISSYLMQFFTGSWSWDTYAVDYKIHFQGRIALSPSIRFGIGGVVFLYILQPLFEKIVSFLGENKVKIISIILIILLSIDCVYSFVFKKTVCENILKCNEISADSNKYFYCEQLVCPKFQKIKRDKDSCIFDIQKD